MTTQSPEHPIVVQNDSRGAGSFQITTFYGDNGNWRRRGGSGAYSDDPEIYRSIFSYLRQKGQTYNDGNLLQGLTNAGRSFRPQGVIKAIIEAGIPMAENSMYKPVIYEDKPYLVNTQNPRNSNTVSDQTGKLVKANIPPALAARMLGNAAPPAVAQAAATTGRRGRPAGQPNTPRPAAAPSTSR